MISNVRLSRGTTLLIGALITTLVALNVALIIQNRSLKRLMVERENSGILKVGTQLPPLSGLDIDGREFTLDYRSDQRRSVLLVLSPRCAFCTKNMPNWKAIVERINPDAYRVVGVSLVPEGVREYLTQNGLSNLPVVMTMDAESKESYRLGATPQTVLIDSQGKVVKVWAGLIQPTEWSDVEQTLSLNTMPAK